MWVLNNIQKSVQRVKDNEGLCKEEVALANESATSLPKIPEWLGPHTMSRYYTILYELFLNFIPIRKCNAF